MTKFFKIIGVLVLIIILLGVFSYFYLSECVMPVGLRAQMPDESDVEYNLSLQSYIEEFLQNRPTYCNLGDLLFKNLQRFSQ